MDDDWEAILALANVAVPFDPDGNARWLENRRGFQGRRFHHLAEESDGRPRGYAGAEEGDLEGVYRIFLVMSPDDLQSGPGDVLFRRLLDDLEAAGARLLWAREYAEDGDLIADLRRRGFTERERFSAPGLREMVVLDRDMAVPPAE